MMFGKHQAMERFTMRQRLHRLLAGSLVFGIVVAPTYFISLHPEWLTWLIRGFAGLWLIDWWRRHLAGILTPERENLDHSQK